MAATGAFAQSSVTIGGQLDVGLQSISYANDKSVSNLGSGIHGASRVWFTGTEDLGGGMSANWRLEMQPNLADGSTSANLFNRGAWAGLKGGFGEIRAGRQGSNTIGAICTIDQHGCYSGFYGGGLLFSGQAAPGAMGASLFAANPTPGITTVAAAKGQATNTGALSQATSTAGDSTRYINQVRYTLPTFVAGLSLNAAYAFGQSNVLIGQGGTNGNTYGFDGAYTAGPLTVVGAYQKAQAEYTAAGSAAKPSGDLMTIGGTYDLTVAKVGLGYQKEKATDNALFKDAVAFGMTVTVPMGALTPYVKYGQRKYTMGDNSTFTSAKVANIGARYALSKRTLVYVDYVNNGVKKEDFLFNAQTATAAPSIKSMTSLGLQHSF